MSTKWVSFSFFVISSVINVGIEPLSGPWPLRSARRGRLWPGTKDSSFGEYNHTGPNKYPRTSGFACAKLVNGYGAPAE